MLLMSDMISYTFFLYRYSDRVGLFESRSDEVIFWVLVTADSTDESILNSLELVHLGHVYVQKKEFQQSNLASTLDVAIVAAVFR